MSDRDWTELAAAYALGALDDDERSAFERQLAQDPELQREVSAYEEVVGELGQTLTAEAAPAELRERILARAREVRPIRQARPDRPAAAGGRLPWLAAAAGILLALGLGDAYRQAADERERLQSLYDDALARLAVADSLTAAQDSILAGFIGSEVHVVSLAAAETAPTARVFWNHTRSTFVVTAFQLPPPPPGQTYQLWAIAEGEAPVSMGTFATDAQQQAFVTLPVPAEVAAIELVDLCAITLEPVGGSPQPTEAPRFVGEWLHVD